MRQIQLERTHSPPGPALQMLEADENCLSGGLIVGVDNLLPETKHIAKSNRHVSGLSLTGSCVVNTEAEIFGRQTQDATVASHLVGRQPSAVRHVVQHHERLAGLALKIVDTNGAAGTVGVRWGVLSLHAETLRPLDELAESRHSAELPGQRSDDFRDARFGRRLHASHLDPELLRSQSDAGLEHLPEALGR